MQKLCMNSLIRFHLLLFPLPEHHSQNISITKTNNIYITKTYCVYLPVFTSRIFAISGLTSKVLTYFEKFLSWYERVIQFILLHVAAKVIYSHLLKRLSFPYCIVYFLWFHRLILPKKCTFISCTLFCSIELWHFVPVPMCFDYCSFVVQLVIMEVDTSSSVSFLQDCYSSWVFCVSTQILELFCPSSVKNDVGIL